jgi:hypothetical protein
VALVRVAAVIVTRGDQDLTAVVTSLPEEWEVVIWDNSREEHDLSVYGRYAAIERTDAELIYVQDDDCVVGAPQAIVDTWDEMRALAEIEQTPDPTAFIVCNMPPEFRHEFYEEHALVGFGACFHRDVPERAFRRWDNSGVPIGVAGLREEIGFFRRTCDIVVTGLTPRVLVQVPVENLPWSYYWDRMYRQPEHQAERVRMLDLVRQIA